METTNVEKQYPLIYVDAPWESEQWPLEKIRGLPVEKWAAEDALLLMWAPMALVPDALLLLRVWKFDYAGLLMWRKQNENIDAYWFACNGEFLLVAKRGVAKTSYLLRHTIYDGARTEGEYKPEGFRSLLLTAGFICFDKIVPHLDLFGAYWQCIYPEYKKKDWDFLEG